MLCKKPPSLLRGILPAGKLLQKIAEGNSGAACGVHLHGSEKGSHSVCSTMSNRPVEFLKLRDRLVSDPAVLFLDMVVADTSSVIDAHDGVIL